MLNITRQELQRALDILNAELEIKDNRIHAINKNIGLLQSQAEEIETVIRVKKHNIEILKEALVICSGLPDKVQKTRDKILNLVKKSERKDITIAEKEDLDNEIEKLKGVLQKSCKHPFVTGYQSYEGSSTRDYEDGYQGYRLCAACGFSEHSKETIQTRALTKEDIYPTLNENYKRIIGGNQLRHPDRFFDVWRPLEELLKDFINPEVYKIMGRKKIYATRK